MKLNKMRFNPHPDKSKWLEYAQVLEPVIFTEDFSPKLVKQLWDDLDGGVMQKGKKVILFNADGDEIVTQVHSLEFSFQTAINKLGEITDNLKLQQYMFSKQKDKYKQKHMPKKKFVYGSQKSLFPKITKGSPKQKDDFFNFPQQKKYRPPPLKPAYGGLVINPQGKILVVEPANHFSGVVWTFPKGKLDEGETPEQTAKREVHEESGWNTKIVAKIDGQWKGSTSINEYFLMQPVGQQEEWQFQGTSKQETWRAIFVDYECARLLVSSSHKQSAKRDVEVLDKGYLLWKKLNGLL